MNAADPFQVGVDRPPATRPGSLALSQAELEALVAIGEGGGMLQRSRLDAQTVQALLEAALVWPKGQVALGLTARGVQVLAAAARRAVV